MRDYAELIERLRYCADRPICFSTQCDYRQTAHIGACFDSLKHDAADAIEELLAAVPKWISVKERLPEESGYTIIFCADGDRGHVTFGKFLKTPKLWELSGARSYWRVLWWMPLPEPPKEVE